jgi:hypothetical protein
MTKIRVTWQTANIRETPAMTEGNIAGVAARGYVIDSAEQQGDWWRFYGYLHKSVVEVVPDMSFPYISQWDAEANMRSSDCGQTCVAMGARSRGKQVKPNDLRVGDPRGYTTAYDLVNAYAFCGIEASVVHPSLPHTVVAPAICLVDYAAVPAQYRQDSYRGWHWVMLLSIDKDCAVCHDPNFWGARRREGMYKQYPRAVWDKIFVPAYSKKMLERAKVALSRTTSVRWAVQLTQSSRSVKQAEWPRGLFSGRYGQEKREFQKKCGRSENRPP